MSMNAADVIAYICDGAAYCTDCASEWPAHFHACNEPGRLFDPGWHDCGELGPDGSPCHIEADEGEVSPVFVDEYNFDNPYTCDTCGELIEEP